MASQSQLRTSDADRQAAIEHLATALASGRLRIEEYDERVERAFRALTYGELEALQADLPVPLRAAPVAARSACGPAHKHGAAWTVWATVTAINVVIWALVCLSSARLVYFWPMWVAGPWGAVLASTTALGRGHRAGPRRAGA